MLKKTNELITERKHFQTSRLLDYLSRKELITQTGHRPSEWPLVILKELIDNGLDACEEAGIAPVISVKVDADGVTITDNGPGIPAEVIDKVLDFSIRVSSREAYVAPDRGAQGNAWKTLVPMPFVLFGSGVVTITAQGIRHEIEISVDHIRQVPKIDHRKTEIDGADGTVVFVEFPGQNASLLEDEEDDDFYNSDFDDDDEAHEKASLLQNSRRRFLQLAERYCWLNPHLTLSVSWFGDAWRIERTDPDWQKWIPSNPSDPHWYDLDNLKRLIAAHLGHGETNTLREFVTQFRGLKSTVKVKKVLADSKLSRATLGDLVTADQFDEAALNRLLTSMKEHTRPVKPKALGVIGEDHFRHHCERIGGDMDSFNYQKVLDTDSLPTVIETVFCYLGDEVDERNLVTGVNWSPGIVNPFRQLGELGDSLDSVLGDAHVSRYDPVLFLLHAACPKVAYADRGKSSVIVEG